MVQARVEEGAYLDSHLKFFRDLLLLLNNAMVFFSKNSPEFLAAGELRNLISNMSQKSAKSDTSSDKKQQQQHHQGLIKRKSKRLSCLRRKVVLTQSSCPINCLLKLEEPRITKKRSRDRFAPVSANIKKNGRNGVNKNSKQTSAATLEKSQGKGGSSSQQQEPRSESKNKNSGVDLKKRSAANFLNRMKQGSSSNNGSLLDALKSAPLTTGNSCRGGFDSKKNENGKKERVSDVNQTKEKGSRAKKSLWRPPKKGAAPPPPPPTGKHSRDGRESESVAGKILLVLNDKYLQHRVLYNWDQRWSQARLQNLPAGAAVKSHRNIWQLGGRAGPPLIHPRRLPRPREWNGPMAGQPWLPSCYLRHEGSRQIQRPSFHLWMLPN